MNRLQDVPPKRLAKDTAGSKAPDAPRASSGRHRQAPRRRVRDLVHLPLRRALGPHHGGPRLLPLELRERDDGPRGFAALRHTDLRPVLQVPEARPARPPRLWVHERDVRVVDLSFHDVDPPRLLVRLLHVLLLQVQSLDDDGVRVPVDLGHHTGFCLLHSGPDVHGVPFDHPPGHFPLVEDLPLSHSGTTTPTTTPTPSSAFAQPRGEEKRPGSKTGGRKPCARNDRPRGDPI
mmetsp:Transcript_7223/g.24824  ORF Transcript_7223/g.24824 Transcript_7223/m.24824 type:complete len:234 (+) Transcript_7223:20-721(+)